MKNSKNLPANERMDEAATLWKAMDSEVKDEYVNKVKKVSEMHNLRKGMNFLWNELQVFVPYL